MINITRQVFFPDGSTKIFSEDKKRRVTEYSIEDIRRLCELDLIDRHEELMKLNDEYKDIYYLCDVNEDRDSKLYDNAVKRYRLRNLIKSNKNDRIDCYIWHDGITVKSRDSIGFNIEYIYYKNKNYLEECSNHGVVLKIGDLCKVYRHKGVISNTKYKIIVEDNLTGFKFYNWFIIEYINRCLDDSGPIEIHIVGVGGKENVPKAIRDDTDCYTGVLAIVDSLDNVYSRTMGVKKDQYITRRVTNELRKKVYRSALFAPLSVELVLISFEPMIASSDGVIWFRADFFQDVLNTMDKRSIIGFNRKNVELLGGKYDSDYLKFCNSGSVKNYGKTKESMLATLLAGYTFNTCYRANKNELYFPWMKNCCKLGSRKSIDRSKNCGDISFMGEDKLELWCQNKCIKELIKLINYVIMGVGAISIKNISDVEIWRH